MSNSSSVILQIRFHGNSLLRKFVSTLRRLAMAVFSGLTIPAFRCHVTNFLHTRSPERTSNFTYRSELRI